MLKTPDITPAQGAAALTWAVGQLTIMGVTDQETSKVILSVGLTFMAAAWKIADALIRSGRAKAAASANAVAGGSTPVTELPVS